MICQRCGCCCIMMPVIIRVDDRLKLKPGARACPHLSFNGTQASCAVHDKPWFADTPMPCHVYGNPDYDPDFESKRGKPCLIGQKIVADGGMSSVKWAGIDEMEDMGEVPDAEEDSFGDGYYSDGCLGAAR